MVEYKNAGNANGNGMNRKESDAAIGGFPVSELAVPLLLILKQCVIGAADIVAIVEFGAAWRSAPDRTFATAPPPLPS